MSYLWRWRTAYHAKKTRKYAKSGGEEKDEEEEEEEEEQEEEEEANILLLHFVQAQKTQAVIHINSNNDMLSKHLEVLGHLISHTCRQWATFSSVRVTMAIISTTNTN